MTPMDKVLVYFIVLMGVGAVVMAVVLVIYYWLPEYRKRKWWRM